MASSASRSSTSTKAAAYSFRKRLVFVLAAAILVGVCIECGAHALHYALRGELIPRAGQRQKIAELASAPLDIDLAQPASEIQDRFGGQILHPYIGSLQPHSRFLKSEFWGRQTPDVLRVGIFGGSFAGGVHDENLLLKLRIEGLTGRRVQLLPFAIAGGKQPQQLMSLAYLLALGERIDVILNIDGYNEVAMAPIYNIPKGVFPAYPRDWYYRAATIGRAELSWRESKLLGIEEQRTGWARRFTGLPGYSNVGLLFWNAVDSSLRREYEQIHTATRDEPPMDTSLAVSGPKRNFEDQQELDRFLAEVWRDSSIQMHAVAHANDIVYAHFLQPNQYVPDSKPMSREERAIAIRPREPGGLAVRRNYPALLAMAGQLRAAGVSFHDLTDIYSKREDALYRDSCCHVNREGYQIVANAIVDALASEGVWERFKR